MIDTLKISKKLRTNGFSENQAAVLTQVIATQEERLASEKSVEDLRNDMNKNFDLMRADMDKNLDLMRADMDKNLDLIRQEMRYLIKVSIGVTAGLITLFGIGITALAIFKVF